MEQSGLERSGHGTKWPDTVGCYPRSKPSINPQFTLDQYLINSSIDTGLTSQSTATEYRSESTTYHFCRHTIKCQSIGTFELVDTWPTFDWVSSECQSEVDRVVDWVSTKYRSRCPSIADRDVAGVWSRVNEGDKGLMKGINWHLTTDVICLPTARSIKEFTSTRSEIPVHSMIKLESTTDLLYVSHDKLFFTAN